jgi:hypothetical protein
MYPLSFKYVEPWQCCSYCIDHSINNQPLPRFWDSVIHLMWTSFCKNPCSLLSFCLDACFIRIPDMVNLYVRLISNPSTWWMPNLKCFFLNQYRQKFLSTLLHKGVSLVWISFTTFICNYCRLIDSSTSYIEKTQTTIA